MNSLIQADKVVNDLNGMLEQRSEYQGSKTIHKPSSLLNVDIPKLVFLPKKPSSASNQNGHLVAPGRLQNQTSRDAGSNAGYATAKRQQDEIKLLRLTIEQLTKDRDGLLAQNTALLKASSDLGMEEIQMPPHSSKVKVLPESHTQSLGLYSCEMIDPMNRVPRSFRLRVLARHRRHSPTKTINSKVDSATCANVADFSSESAQRVAYTSGRLMAQYILNADTNSQTRFHSLTAYCRTKLAHARQAHLRSPPSGNVQGRQSQNPSVNPFTLATACHCMKHIIEACPMYQDVMNEVFAEIMLGLYAPDTIHYKDASNTQETGRAAPADALLRHLKNIPYCELNRFIAADLFLAQTELNDSWLLAKRVLLVEDSLSMIIEKQQKTYQTVSRRFHFNAWADALHSRRIWRDNFMQKAIKMHRMRHQSKAFCAWQACMDLAEMGKTVAELTASLADDKRVLSGEMWNLRDQIKCSDEEMASLRLKMADFTTLRQNAHNWRKRSADITGHVAVFTAECNESDIRLPFPITSIFQLYHEEQKPLNPQIPTYVRVGGTEAIQQQTPSGNSRPGTSNASTSQQTQNGSRPGSSNRPGSAGQPQSLEMIVARLLASPVEEIIARMVLAGTGVPITGWSDKLILSGLLHSRMLDFMQMQEYETAHKDTEAAAEIWASVLSRAKHLGAAFHDSVTTTESLMGKSAVTRCLLMADIILNCGCPPISPLWSTFRQQFVTSEDHDGSIVAIHKQMQHLASSSDSAHELSNQEDLSLNASLEKFIKDCPEMCQSSISAYRDAIELSSCMRVMQEIVRRWFSIASLKLGDIPFDLCMFVCISHTFS